MPSCPTNSSTRSSRGCPLARRFVYSTRRASPRRSCRHTFAMPSLNRSAVASSDGAFVRCTPLA
ncbi:hypothetical protein ACHAXN_001897 [Cyclotella atomus]